MAVSLARDLRLGMVLLFKEQVCDGDGGDDSGEVGHQPAGEGVSCVADAYAAEINGEDVKRGVGGALEDAGKTSHEGVGAEGLHGIYHHAACSGSGEWFHECGGQCSHEAAVEAEGIYAACHTADEHVHGSGGAEYTDGHENGHEIGNDAHGGAESVACAFDESVVNIHLLPHGGQDEADDDGHQ